jgi:DNA-binding CsgD family transcriptional regulator
MHKLDILNDKLQANSVGGKKKPKVHQVEITLTRREKQILYYLSLNKSVKEIANILSQLENKTVSFLTVHSILNKKLYPKFDVLGVSQLIAKAHELKLIPFVLDGV